MLSLALFGAACTTTPPKDCVDSDGCSTGTSDTGAVCAQLAAETPDGQPVSITVRNDRDVTVFVPWATDDCTWEPLTLWADGERLLWDADNAYIPGCESLLVSQCSFGCSDGPSSMLRLEPGASYALPWSGYVYAPMRVDGACATANDCADGSVCWAGRQLQGESLTARLRVGEICDLETCTCAGDACLLTQDSLSIGAVEAEAIEYAIAYEGSDIVLAISP